MNNHALEELTDRVIRTPIKMAISQRESLVPILGAGVSLSLGLPNWKSLVANLAKLANLDANSETDPPDLLEEVRQRLGEITFVANIQQLLSLSADVTSTTLQAIVSAKPRRIITTNLDLAIETAFRKAQRALSPANIGRGYTVEELHVGSLVTSEPALLKIHGSIERPSTWVLTRRDYDNAYVQTSSLRTFLASKVTVPLFIGFSFSDFDINESLRLAKVIDNRRAYSIIHIDRARQLEAKFKALGIIPIAFFSYDQIPEIIDEIFGCEQLTIHTERHLDNKPPGLFLRIGASQVEIANSIHHDVSVPSQAISILANALELQPNQSIITRQSRRLYGPKGVYVDEVIRLVNKKQSGLLEVVLNGLSHYPEVLLTNLTNAVLRNEGIDHFFFLTRLIDSFSKANPIGGQLDSMLLAHLHDQVLDYQCRRDVAKVCAQRHIHPALQMPPVSVSIGTCLVLTYPLTRFQVATLLGQDVSAIEHPLRPHTIHSIEEAGEIIVALRKSTSLRWRFPTEKEWIEISGIDSNNQWPWGKESPEYKQHAHLKYVDHGGSVANHPLEVGIFPKGKSRTGLFDLVGNTYELVMVNTLSLRGLDSPAYGAWSSRNNYLLAGGAWSTAYIPKATHGWKMIHGFARGENNVGLRPIVQR